MDNPFTETNRARVSPHFQRRETVLRVAQAAGFCEVNFFGKKMAYTLHLEKSEPAREK